MPSKLLPLKSLFATLTSKFGKMLEILVSVVFIWFSGKSSLVQMSLIG